MNRLTRQIVQRLEEMSPTSVFVIVALYMICLAAMDCFAGLQLSLSLFYVLGCVFLSWRAGYRMAVWLSVCVAVTVGMVDWLFVPEIRSAFLVIWNLLARLGLMWVASWLTSEVTRLTSSLSHLVEERTAQWKSEAERHQATASQLEAALARSKRKAESLHTQAWILENMGEAMVLTDLAGNIEMTNPAAERLLGYADGELVGKSITLLSPFTESQTPDKFKTLQQKFEQETQWSGEIPIRKKSGQVLIAQVNLTRLQSGDRTLLIALYQDVTERRQAEAALRESEETYRALIETTGTGYLILDTQGRVQDANAEYLRLSGHSSLKDILGRSVVEWTAPHDAQRNAAAVEECLKTGGVRGLEIDYAGPGGLITPIEITAKVVQTSKGERILSLCRDITARKQAERQLIDALELNRSIIAASPVGMAAYKASGECVFANETLGRLAGCSVGDLLQQNFNKLESWRASGFLALAEEALSRGLSKATDIYTITSFGRALWVQFYAARFMSVGEPHLLVMVEDITKRKRAEEALALSQQQLAAAIDLAHIANWEYDVATGLYTFDDRFFALYGTSTQREGGSRMTPQAYVREFFFPEDAHLVAEGLAKALATSDPGFEINHEHRIRRRDGTVGHVLVRAALVRDASGRTIKIRGANQDITERKRAEEALALSQQQLAEAMDLARLANWEYDVATGLYTFDDRFFALYGTTVEREGGSRMSPQTYMREFFFPEDAHLVTEGLAKSLAAADPNSKIELEHRIRRRDNKVGYVLVRAVPVKEPSGRTIKIRGANQDITERKQAEQQLADALELNQKIFAASAIGVSAFRASGDCVFVNERLARIIGGSVKDILRQNFHQIDSWRSSGLWRLANDVLSRGRPLSGEFELNTRFGRHIWLDVHLSTFASGGEPHLLVLTLDVTERKRVERQILDIADREQARIGQDLHDGLCQQLVSLAFDANALQRKLSGPGGPEAVTAARITEALDQAITESRRLSRGLFPIRLEAEGLASALEELARTTSGRFGVKCGFESPPSVLVHDLIMATHLYRIAQEAVNNAVKHARPTTISIQLKTQAETLELRIENDGAGFSPGSPGKLAGMGLYIMQYRANSIGATLRIDPRTGEQDGGTAVSCCVPWPLR